MSVIPKSGDQKYAFQEEQDRQKSDSERVANKRGQSHSKNFDNDNNLLQPIDTNCYTILSIYCIYYYPWTSCKNQKPSLRREVAEPLFS